GVSEDGSYLYFAASAALAPGAAPGNCRPSGSEGICNLYVAHDTGAGWTTTFIAALSSIDDQNNWSSPYLLPAQVSHDGAYLAFMSDRSLTGYDNRDVVSGQPDEEVYLYHASHLTCASCNPT